MSSVPVADVADVVNSVTGAVVGWLTQLSVLDWVVVGLGTAGVAWAWTRAVAFSRLGTVEVSDFATDKADDVEPKTRKAELQKALGERGWLPSSLVPAGSPTAEKLVEAIAGSPIPQAKWLSSLIALIPVPPSTVSFKVTGTFEHAKVGPGRMRCGVYYQLACLGPAKSVRMGHITDTSWARVMEATSIAIFREMMALAPGIYPRWALFSSAKALTLYRSGLNIEKNVTPRGGDDPPVVDDPATIAYWCYTEASRVDPDNMLARLRAANCIERITPGAGAGTEKDQRIAALKEYVSIRLREPTLFWAGYRASVLLSLLADSNALTPADYRPLNTLLDRLEQEKARHVDADDLNDSSSRVRFSERARRAIMRALIFWGFISNVETLSGRKHALRARLSQAAWDESQRARKRLRPLWTMRHEGRFRHQYEPQGQERRQLRKALGVSRLCIRARRAEKNRDVSDLVQFLWRGWLFWRYMLGRWHVAGWQAHYNAACFYALLPQANDENVPFGSTRIRMRALKHLERAIDESGGAISCRYVRDEDPDLAVLRTKNKIRFDRAIRRLCPREMLVHHWRPAESEQPPVVWGEGSAAPSGETVTPLPVPSDDGKDLYRVTVLDENLPVWFGYRPNGPKWKLIATELPIEIWLVGDNEKEVFEQKPPTQSPPET